MKELKHGDNIYFTVGDEVFPYRVGYSFLNYSKEDGDNNAVFIALGLNAPQKIDLASYHYGYLANQGDWPEYKNNDYDAAIRLVKALYDMCNIHNTKKQ